MRAGLEETCLTPQIFVVMMAGALGEVRSLQERLSHYLGSSRNHSLLRSRKRPSLIGHSFGRARLQSNASSAVPRVASTTFWSSLIPRLPWKPPGQSSNQTLGKGWNPATYFIVMALIIGSQGIRIIAEEREILSFSRNTEAKIELLRKVLDSLHRGEHVDVEKVLGTGDETMEKEWEDGLWPASLSVHYRLMESSPQGNRVARFRTAVIRAAPTESQETGRK